MHDCHVTNANMFDVLRSKQKRPAHMRITMNHLIELVSFTLRIVSIAEQIDATCAKWSRIARELKRDLEVGSQDLTLHQQQMGNAIGAIRAKVADCQADIRRAEARYHMLNEERHRLVLEEAVHQKALEEHAMSHAELQSIRHDLGLQLAKTHERLEANEEASKSFEAEITAFNAKHQLLTNDASTRYDELADEGQAAQEVASARQDALEARMGLLPERVFKLKKSLEMATSRRQSGH